MAKENLKKNLGNCFLAEVIGSALMLVGRIVPFGAMIVEGPLEVGITEVYVKSSRQEKTSVKDLLTGFKDNFGENFILGILRDLLVILWSVLFIIPGVIKNYSYTMSIYLITRNHELTAMEALKESKRLMKGHRRELFLMDLSFLGWILLTIVTLGIAGFYTIPYIHETHTIFYNNIYEDACVSC